MIDDRQRLLDRRCGRNHPKRHSTNKRRSQHARAKAAKAKAAQAAALKKRRAVLSAIRAYWRHEADDLAAAVRAGFTPP